MCFCAKIGSDNSISDYEGADFCLSDEASANAGADDEAIPAVALCQSCGGTRCCGSGADPGCDNVDAADFCEAAHDGVLLRVNCGYDQDAISVFAG
ncbi:hypothetical protein D3C79_1029800 [compost metagenome]